MTRAVDIEGRGVRVNGRSVGVGSVIPDSEDWEHNDLTGVYSGETGDPSIQTSVVQSGLHALKAGPAGSSGLIVRDTTPQSPRGFEGSWYVNGDSNDQFLDSALALVSSGTTKSGFDGYTFYLSTDSYQIRRYDGGSLTTLVQTSDDGVVAGSWEQWSFRYESSDLVLTSPSGNQISATDTTYSDVHLGWVYFGGQYIDNAQFQKL